MSRLGARCWLALILANIAWENVAHGQVITNVVRGGTTTNPAPVIVPAGMGNGAVSYVDRTYTYQQVPTFLQGTDFIRVSNVDRNVPDYTLDVTLGSAANLYLLIDFRVGDGLNTDPPVLTTLMTWVGANGFTNTGSQLAIDENNDGTIDNFFQIYSRTVSAGVTRLFEQNDGTGRNMYGVAASIAAVPEPGALVLACFAGALVLRMRRRMAP